MSPASDSRTTLPAGGVLSLDGPAVDRHGVFIVAAPATVVVNLGNDDFRAFTARCPRAGCLVGSVTTAGTVGPCRGSTFDVRTGRVLVGPARQGLRALPATFTAGTRTLSVNAA